MCEGVIPPSDKSYVTDVKQEIGGSQAGQFLLLLPSVNHSEMLFSMEPLWGKHCVLENNLSRPMISL